MQTYIAYYRVSTQRQGQSGLGLDAQRAAVSSYVARGGALIAEYTEVESGKKDRRPQLNEAMVQAKRTGARLVIAKLDRLSRNATFTLQLRDSGVDFVCCDMPDANTLTIGLMAVIAQYEREMISQRTRAALHAKQARGFKLGGPCGFPAQAHDESLRVRQANALSNLSNIQLGAIIREKRQQGMTMQAIADYLNEHGYKTRRGCKVTTSTVQRLNSSSVGSVIRHVDC